MHEIWIIIEREFRERVQTRSFVIGTLAFPVFMFAIFFLPALVGSDDAQRRLVIVDDAPEGVAAVFVQALQNTGTTVDADIGGGDAEAVMEAASQGETPYRVEVVPGPADIAALNERVLMKEIDGYVVLPSDVMATGAVQYRARNITNQAVFRDIRLAATAALQFARLGSAGVDASAIQQLMAPVEVTSARITEGGEEGGDAQSTFFVAYILAFLAYFVIAMYGHAVMRSVIQEKVTRISEILVSTMRATHLMAGKIAGVSAAALLQVAIWAIMVVVAVSQSEALQEHFGVSATAMDALALEPAIGVILILYFILGFLLYAALFAGLGAAMSSEQEAQPYQMVLMLPLFVPLLFLGPLTSDPEGSLSTFLSLFPLTAPVAMPMRLGATPPDTGTVTLSLGLLVLSSIVLAWIAGKIYRVGILATGKRPSLGELVRWVRAA